MTVATGISPTTETFDDELDSHIEESLQNAEYRAASIDVERRIDLLKTLVEMRKDVGLTQKQIARRMGVGQSTVSGFETEGSDPRLSTVQRYARAVEAECLVVVHNVQRCDWIAPAHVYAERQESGRSVQVDFSESSHMSKAWASAADSKRTDFALAS
jgi:transcriptional regulator with XRE-family HTH domain